MTEKIIAEEISDICDEPEPEIIDEDFTKEEIEKIQRILNKRKQDGNLEKWNIIKNPFCFQSDFEVRVSPEKDPRIQKGNTDFLTAYSTDKNIQLINELDSNTNYIFGKNKLETSQHKSYLRNYDYEVPAEALNYGRKEQVHKEGLPLSFINIKTEIEGVNWYREHYPKIPEDLLPIIARYHWGEPLTKKSVKNERKKINKKASQKGLHIENKKVSVLFD